MVVKVWAVVGVLMPMMCWAVMALPQQLQLGPIMHCFPVTSCVSVRGHLVYCQQWTAITGLAAKVQEWACGTKLCCNAGGQVHRSRAGSGMGPSPSTPIDQFIDTATPYLPYACGLVTDAKCPPAKPQTPTPKEKCEARGCKWVCIRHCQWWKLGIFAKHKCKC
jgi:hypothetical protein